MCQTCDNDDEKMFGLFIIRQNEKKMEQTIELRSELCILKQQSENMFINT